MRRLRSSRDISFLVFQLCLFIFISSRSFFVVFLGLVEIVVGDVCAQSVPYRSWHVLSTVTHREGAVVF